MVSFRTLALVLALSLATTSMAAINSTYGSGPMAGKPIAVAWGRTTLENYTGFTAAQFTNLRDFSALPELLEQDNLTAIWDYFPMGNETNYPLTMGPLMQAPLVQDPQALVATACDICHGVPNERLVNLGVNDTNWKDIWENVHMVYENMLSTKIATETGNATNFKMAMNWFTYNSNTSSSDINATDTSSASEQTGTPLCSTIFLEGLTDITSAASAEILSVLPTHFQDLSVHCGCDFDNTGPGSKGSPFRGGWQVVMRGRQEAWRFRIESAGASCVAQGLGSD